jgi:hypothetical protein
MVEAESGVVSLQSGAELRVVDTETVVAGVTIEYSLATDQEEGPDELDQRQTECSLSTRRVNATYTFPLHGLLNLMLLYSCGLPRTVCKQLSIPFERQWSRLAHRLRRQLLKCKSPP